MEGLRGKGTPTPIIRVSGADCLGDEIGTVEDLPWGCFLLSESETFRDF